MKLNVWDELMAGDTAEALTTVLKPKVQETKETPARPWPPVMIRDFIDIAETTCRAATTDLSVGHVADFLSSSPGAVIAIYDQQNYLRGVIVDDDVMALVKRDGINALDYPILEGAQRQRPVCSVTDSPYVVLSLMRDQEWDRIAVAERGRVIGIIHRRQLVRFCEG